MAPTQGEQSHKISIHDSVGEKAECASVDGTARYLSEGVHDDQSMRSGSSGEPAGGEWRGEASKSDAGPLRVVWAPAHSGRPPRVKYELQAACFTCLSA